jgi:hypothetical protein
LDVLVEARMRRDEQKVGLGLDPERVGLAAVVVVKRYSNVGTTSDKVMTV